MNKNMSVTLSFAAVLLYVHLCVYMCFQSLTLSVSRVLNKSLFQEPTNHPRLYSYIIPFLNRFISQMWNSNINLSQELSILLFRNNQSTYAKQYWEEKVYYYQIIINLRSNKYICCLLQKKGAGFHTLWDKLFIHE